MAAAPQSAKAKRASSPSHLLWEHAVEAVRAAGVDVDALLASLPADVRAREDGWWGRGAGPVAVQSIAAFIASVTGNDRIGLRLGAQQQSGAFGVFDYLLATARSVRGAVAVAQTFAPLVYDYIGLEVRESSTTARLGMVPPAGLVLHPLVVDYRLVCLWRLCGVAELGEAVLREGFAVDISYPEPPSLEPYRAIFGASARLRFGAETPGLEIPVAWLDRPRAHDAELHAILREHAERLLAQVKQMEASFADRVKAALIHSLHTGRPTIDRTARQLRTSPRTLRRRLAEEGATYKNIVDHVRASLAGLYLADARVDSEAIAERLGFESGRAFRRALHRWTGRSVREHRSHSP